MRKGQRSNWPVIKVFLWQIVPEIGDISRRDDLPDATAKRKTCWMDQGNGQKGVQMEWAGALRGGGNKVTVQEFGSGGKKVEVNGECEEDFLFGTKV